MSKLLQMKRRFLFDLSRGILARLLLIVLLAYLYLTAYCLTNQSDHFIVFFSLFSLGIIVEGVVAVGLRKTHWLCDWYAVTKRLPFEYIFSTIDRLDGDEESQCHPWKMLIQDDNGEQILSVFPSKIRLILKRDRLCFRQAVAQTSSCQQMLKEPCDWPVDMYLRAWKTRTSTNDISLPGFVHVSVSFYSLAYHRSGLFDFKSGWTRNRRQTARPLSPIIGSPTKRFSTLVTRYDSPISIPSENFSFASIDVVQRLLGDLLRPKFRWTIRDDRHCVCSMVRSGAGQFPSEPADLSGNVNFSRRHRFGYFRIHRFDSFRWRSPSEK